MCPAPYLTRPRSTEVQGATRAWAAFGAEKFGCGKQGFEKKFEPQLICVMVCLFVSVYRHLL